MSTIKGVKVVTRYSIGKQLVDDNVLHTPCKDKDGNIYLPFLVMKNSTDSELYYLCIPKDLPIVDVEE